MTTEVELLQHGRSAASTLPQPCRIRPAGRSAQRHQGGGRRPGDSRGAECHGGLILHKQQRTQRWRAGSGRQGVRHSGIKGEPSGRRTAAELNATAA